MSKHHHHDQWTRYDYPQNNFSLKNMLGKIFDSLFTNFLSSKGILKTQPNNEGYSDNQGNRNSRGGLLNTLLNFANGFSNNNFRGDSMSSNNSSKGHKNDRNDKNNNTSELGDTLNSILQNIDMNQILQILASSAAQTNNRNQNTAAPANNNEQNPLASLINGLTSPEILDQLTEAINKTKNNK